MNTGFYEDAPFQSLKETQKRTGLSRPALYAGAREGKYPHIRSGNRILFHVPKLLEMLENECMNQK